MAARRRILIDTTLIRFSGVRSGVPRVASAYVEAGMALGASRGIDVLPVVFDGGAWFVNDVVPREWWPGGAPPRFPLDVLRRVGRRSVQPPLGGQDARAVATPVAPPVASPLATAAAAPEEPTGESWRARLRRLAKTDLKVRLGPGDCVLSPGFWHDLPPQAFALVEAAGAETAILVHDLLPLSHPEHYDGAWRLQFRERMLRIAGRASHVFAISRQTAAELSAFLRGHGIDRRVDLALNGIERRFLDHAARGGPTRLDGGRSGRRHFLMVGSIEPKKNHVFVLDELAPILAREGGDARLTIVGRLGWLHEPIVRRIDEACREGDVRWLQDCDDDGLLALYAEADALIQASQAEGFGLPIIEAAAMGSPVICSRHPTAREVAPPDARFFDLRPGDLAATVAALDRPALAQWKAAIAQRPWRSWAETVSEVFDVILRMA